MTAGQVCRPLELSFREQHVFVKLALGPFSADAGGGEDRKCFEVCARDGATFHCFEEAIRERPGSVVKFPGERFAKFRTRDRNWMVLASA